MAEMLRPLQLHTASFIVIPARLASTRLPRKLLLRETGKSLLQHTYEASQQATRPSDICVAADHDEIASEVRGFGGSVVMTNPMATCGTDRVAEVAEHLSHIDVIVNVQGDEPEIDGASIDHVIEILERDPLADIATLATPIRSVDKINDPACVKVVFDHAQRALYFSRNAIPHLKNFDPSNLWEHPAPYYQHIGIYAYRRKFLLKFAKLPQSNLEKLENLEQLRALASGNVIGVGIVDEATIGIDTPEDYRAFVERRQAG